jgi:hypothetical protein
MLYRSELFVNCPAIKAAFPRLCESYVTLWTSSVGGEDWNHSPESRRVKRVVNINAAAAAQSAIPALNVA